MENQQNLSSNIMELEHSIGHSGRIVRSVYLHPNQKDFVYISGGCIVICDLQDPHQQTFLREHDDQITCLAISNNGKQIASGQTGDNSDVIIWDFDYKRALFKLSEHDYDVSVVEFSNDDKLLFSCGNTLDKKIFIWNTQNGYIVGSHVMVPETITCMKWGGYVKDIKGRDTTQYQFATAGNRQIYLWGFDAMTGKFQKEYINTGSCNRDYLCLEFSKTREDMLYAGTTSGDFCQFNVKNKSLVQIQAVSAQGVTSLCSSSGNQLLVGCGNGILASFMIDDSKLVLYNKIQLQGVINSLSSSVNGELAILATDQGFIQLVQCHDLSVQLQSENHTQGVNYLVYPDGVSDKFASCSEDGTIRLWDISDYVVTSRCTAKGAGYPQCVSYNEEVLLTGWQDGNIRMFKTDTSELLWTITNAHKDGVTDILLSQNLKFLVTGGQQGEVRVWEMKSRQLISHLKEHTHKVSKIQLLDQDTQLLSASRDRALLKWDLKSEKRTSAHIQRMGGINSFCVLSKDYRNVLTTGQDRKITEWDLQNPNPLQTFDTNTNLKNPDECYSITVSHDGRLFATGGSEQIVRIWDVVSKRLVAEGKGHSGCIRSLQFSYDDKQLISGGNDGNIFVWNIFLD